MRITVIDAQGKRRTVEAQAGLSVMEALREAGLIEGECNGSLACATCHVWLNADWFVRLAPPSDGEEDMLDVAFNLSETSRLCCQIFLSQDTDGIVVTLPDAH
ncbi:2Fe-2S iron-sulfur cluster-binding protein [Algihabitans albus]|uniref:2Fe-2S iron-sulfur cluster-binding protein n=1 Tax=Algihabitans albus TaxID=2164067 RepID=UPI000E5CDAEE|nr:2Fe-2S iron-sulfur cluster-binding protein [Algihabitans albus]